MERFSRFTQILNDDIQNKDYVPVELIGRDYFIYYQKRRGNVYRIIEEEHHQVTITVQGLVLWRFIAAGLALIKDKHVKVLLDAQPDVRIRLETAQAVLEKSTSF